MCVPPRDESVNFFSKSQLATFSLFATSKTLPGFPTNQKQKGAAIKASHVTRAHAEQGLLRIDFALLLNDVTGRGSFSRTQVSLFGKKVIA